MLFFKKIYTFTVIILFSNIPGSIGIIFRRIFYRFIFNKCGTKLTIGKGVAFENPHMISLGNVVRIDDYVKITTGNIGEGKNKKLIGKSVKSFNNIKIEIKNYVHICEYCLISSFSSIKIDNHCTISSFTKMYSVSHHWRNPDKKNDIVYTNSLDKSKNSVLYIGEIIIDENVFIGSNSILFKDVLIKKNVFISPNSVIKGFIKENMIFSNQQSFERFDL